MGTGRILRTILITGGAVGGLFALSGCASVDNENVAQGPDLKAEIRRTAYGVPHIKADDYGGLGYGMGYASAQDNLCQLMDRLLTVSGERAKYLGPGENRRNVVSDFYHRRLLQSGELEALLNGPAESVDTPSQDARDLVRGMAAGISRYIRDTGVEALSDPRCKGQPWVREVSETDLWQQVLAGQVVIQMPGIVAAAPEEFGQDEAALPPVADDPLDEERGLGSNAYGFGGEFTKGGNGVLLGNPHYPWDGQNRFYRIHMMIPGELNVVGAGLITAPIVGIGHTEHIAWTHTVSTARRFGYFELTLNPDNPTEYLYEGEYVPMEAETVTVEIKTGEGEALAEETRTFFSSRYGPMLETEQLPWGRERAYAIRTMPLGLRTIDQYLALYQAKSVRELNTVLAQYQATGFNTTATDSSGEALFGDLGMAPNVTRELAARCTASPLANGIWSRFRVPVLDGSRAECDWQTDPDASAPGVFGAKDQPRLFRSDYVSQANDSHWLTNPEVPLEGFSPVWGDESDPRSLRTRLTLDLVRDRMDGSDGYEGTKFDLETLKLAMFNNRHLGGELVRDDLVDLCRDNVSNELPEALCDALAGWNLKVDLDSRGAHVFHVFAGSGGLRFKTPFDPAKPIDTPADLDVADPKVLEALQTAAGTLAQLKLPLDARWGDVQSETRNGVRIPIHGGAGRHGVFNVIYANEPKPGLGWTNVVHGSSWVMVVEFTEDGPVSEGVLTYSQSTNPESEHHSDQTLLYSAKGWDDLRFTDEAVEAGTIERVEIFE